MTTVVQTNPLFRALDTAFQFRFWNNLVDAVEAEERQRELEQWAETELCFAEVDPDFCLAAGLFEALEAVGDGVMNTLEAVAAALDSFKAHVVSPARHLAP